MYNKYRRTHETECGQREPKRDHWALAYWLVRDSLELEQITNRSHRTLRLSRGRRADSLRGRTLWQGLSRRRRDRRPRFPHRASAAQPRRRRDDQRTLGRRPRRPWHRRGARRRGRICASRTRRGRWWPPRSSGMGGSTGWSSPPGWWPSAPLPTSTTTPSTTCCSSTSSPPLRLIRAALPVLQPGGVILGISAVVAEKPLPNMAVYSAAKAASACTLHRRADGGAATQGSRGRRPSAAYTETGLAGRAIAGAAPNLPTGTGPRCGGGAHRRGPARLGDRRSQRRLLTASSRKGPSITTIEGPLRQLAEGT